MGRVIEKKRTQKETRKKLMKAALDIFSRVGYDAATTRKIAKKAGVNESLIQRYFDSKLGLYLAIKKQYRENMLNEFLSYDESESLEEELVKFIKSRLPQSKQEKKFFKLAVSRAILDPKVRADVQNYSLMKPPALFKRFEGFLNKGQIRPEIDLDQFIEILHIQAFAMSFMINAIESISGLEADELINNTASILARGLAPAS